MESWCTPARQRFMPRCSVGQTGGVPSDEAGPPNPATSRQASIPHSTLALIAGLGVFGGSSFVLLGLGGRELGPALSAPLSVAWTTVNAFGLGLFLPIEQEVSRLMAARRAAGLPAPRLQHVARYLLGTLTLVVLVVATTSGWIADTLFGGQREIVWITAGALAAVAIEYFVRGTLAGFGLYIRYGMQLLVDGIARIVLAVAVFAGPWQSAAAYGVALVLAPLIATALTLSVAAITWLHTSPTPAHSGTIAPLVLTSVTSQLLANSGPLAIAALATAAQQADAGRFVAAVTVGRIPLFLFAAIQAVFLPTLSGLVARSDVEGFRRVFKRAWLATLLLGAVGTAGVASLGGWVMRTIYGPGFEIALIDLTLIAVSGALFMLAQALAQALLSQRADTLVFFAWTIGLVVTVAALLLPLALTTTVAVALCVGAAASGSVLGLAHLRTVAGWEHGLSERNA